MTAVLLFVGLLLCVCGGGGGGAHKVTWFKDSNICNPCSKPAKLTRTFSKYSALTRGVNDIFPLIILWRASVTLSEFKNWCLTLNLLALFFSPPPPPPFPTLFCCSFCPRQRRIKFFAFDACVRKGENNPLWQDAHWCISLSLSPTPSSPWISSTETRGGCHRIRGPPISEMQDWLTPGHTEQSPPVIGR